MGNKKLSLIEIIWLIQDLVFEPADKLEKLLRQVDIEDIFPEDNSKYTNPNVYTIEATRSPMRFLVAVKIGHSDYIWLGAVDYQDLEDDATFDHYLVRTRRKSDGTFAVEDLTQVYRKVILPRLGRYPDDLVKEMAELWSSWKIEEFVKKRILPFLI
jgi:hypothetical protein